MKHSIAAVLTIVLALAACGADAEDATTSTANAPGLPDRPELAVDQMAAALMVQDIEAIRRLTSDRQLAIIVALEGGGATELAAMLEQGVPDDVATNFWTSFVDGFPDLVGESIEDMEFGTSLPTRVQGVEFVSFPVAFGRVKAGTEWFVRLTDDGWRIDLLATFGGPFASALEALVRGTTDPVVLEAFREEAVSIEAAYERLADLETSDRVRDALESLLAVMSG